MTERSVPGRPSVPSAVDRLAIRLCDAGLALAVAMLAVVVALVSLQVAARNLLDLGLPWADELARFAGLWIVWATVPRLLLQGRHISVDVLVARFGGRMASAARLLGELCVLVFSGLMLWSLFAFLRRAGWFATPALGMPNWLFYLPATTGFLLLAPVALLRLRHALRDPGRCRGEPG